MKSQGPTNGVIWITGFSASGKTTLSRKVCRLFQRHGASAIFLDGDHLRSIFGDLWGYDRPSRVTLAMVYMRLCSHLSSQGHVVIISAVAMFREVFEWMRENIADSMQVYLDVPREERERRDRLTKNLLGSSGIDDSMYDVPEHADLTIAHFGPMTADRAAEIVVDTFFERTVSTKDRGRTSHWEAYYDRRGAPLQPSSYAISVLPLLSKGTSLLEIGTGNGRDAAYFATNGVHVTAIDRSAAAITLCRSQHGHLGVDFHCGTLDLLAPAIGTTTYDAAYLRFVLHAMPLQEENETLSMCGRVLKPGGRLFVECRSINDPLARRGEILSPTERIDGHYRRFIVLDELRDRLADAGFDVLEALESDGLAISGSDNPVVIRATAVRRADVPVGILSNPGDGH